MAVETSTKYTCDRCGAETTLPHGWIRLSSVQPSGFAVNAPAAAEYCAQCAKAVYAALELS
jgi:hypothetical protein